MRFPIATIALLLSFVTAGLAQPCPCDCDRNHKVEIAELTTAVGISLRGEDAYACLNADPSRDLTVQVNELVAGVDAALRGCPERSPAELDAARQRWQALALTHYEYRFRVSCFCPGPWDARIEIRDGEIIAIRDPLSGRILDIEFDDHLDTIDQVFDRIANALPTADDLDVTYDPESGVPTEVYIDYEYLLSDDETSVTISELRDLADDTCGTSGDCDGIGEVCIEPGGFAGCGVCFDAVAECASDSDCDGFRQICQPIGHDPQNCACNPDVLVCRQGCSYDWDCPSGTACDPEYRCSPLRCNSDESCPTHFSCALPEGSRTGVCQRRSCEQDASCSDGSCVEGRCYAVPGRCEVIPP